MLKILSLILVLSAGTVSAQFVESDMALDNHLLRFAELGTMAAEAERNAQSIRATHGELCATRNNVEIGFVNAGGSSDTNILAANTALIEVRAACKAIEDAEADALDLLKATQRSFHIALVQSVDGEIAENIAELRTADTNTSVRVDGQDEQLAELITRIAEIENLMQHVNAFCTTNPTVTLCRATN
jgi:hypothetical protein